MEIKYNGHSTKSGIYQIRNLNNGRIYVGSAKHFKSRYYQHIATLRKGTHHNKFLQNDFNKCSEEAFVFEVLEVVIGSSDDRKQTEQVYLDENFLRGSDLCYNAIKTSTVYEYKAKRKTPSDETKRKISESRKGIPAWNKGVYGYQGSPCSEEKKAKISKANKGRKVPRELVEKQIAARGDYSGLKSHNAKTLTGLNLISPDGLRVETIECLTVFCLERGLNQRCMWKVVNRKTASYKGWHLEDYDGTRHSDTYLRGEKHPMYGKKHPPEIREKIKTSIRNAKAMKASGSEILG